MTQYVKHDPITHILERPDMYVGSVSWKESEEWIFEDQRLVKKRVSVCPAMMRCFSEILNNAVDNVERPGKMTKIDISLDSNSCSISNDGAVIPIEIHPEWKIYNHTLIFGHLLSGSNYDDTIARFTTGRNGLGAKLTNVFSKKFVVEGTDSVHHLRFEQTWKRNMKTECEPIVSKFSGKTGTTTVTFNLDWKQFGCDSMPDDCISLVSKIALDAAMTTGLKVTLNGEKLHNKLDQYFSLIDGKKEPIVKLEHERVKIWVSASQDGKSEIFSFVNCMPTKLGGKHVDAVVKAICGPVAIKIGSSVKDVKKKLRLLIVARVQNPTFESQEKNCLEGPSIKIPEISALETNKILKLKNLSGVSVGEGLKSFEEEKKIKILAKTIKTKSLAIEGYDKANFASSAKASQCILIVCEGLSAKTFAVAGIETGMFGKRGRNYFGIFPLRGKLLNVRNASTESISKNSVITSLIKILGLNCENPKNFDKLAYGKCCILTDADVDGIHIEGLLLNFFHSMFPGLLTRNFVVSMKTPILTVVNANKTKFFYDESSEIGKGQVKYIKGLGTTKSKDVCEIFGKKILEFATDEKTDESFRKSFDKAETAERKRWIENRGKNPLKSLDKETEQVIKRPISQHLDFELIKFFIDDCARTLPSVFDGQKESQRKILYASKKRKLISELKVVQLGAYVAEHTGYHHGEANLFNTIIKMAQTFPGSNNVPLLAAEGMFGTRLNGGADAASPRYIYTKMTRHCQTLFPESDVYESVFSEGSEIEPKFYVPVLPVLLLNGSLGIASGWMCSCPSFSIQDVKFNAEEAMNGREPKDIIPHFNGFTGKIEKEGPNKFSTRGIFQRKGSKVIVTELPVGLWNDKFKQMMENDDSILDIKDFSSPEIPKFELEIDPEKFDENDLEKKLTTTVSTSNISVLDEHGIKNVSVSDVFKIWAEKRLEMNEKRRRVQISQLMNEIKLLSEKILFIKLVKAKTIVLTLAEEIVKREMTSRGISNLSLLDLPVRQLTEDNAEKCLSTLEKLKAEKARMEKSTAIDMWKSDLENLSF